MTRAAEQRIYNAVLRLHPAAFRDEFAREMALDFADARQSRAFTPLLADALFSLARQWTAYAFAGPEFAPQLATSAGGRPLLAGQYFMVDRGHLSLFTWARASLMSLLLFLLVAFAANIPNRRGLANTQTASVHHDGGVDTGGGAAPSATGAGSREIFLPDFLPLAVNGTSKRGMLYLGRGRGASAPGLGRRASGGPPAQAKTLTEGILQLAFISIIVWFVSWSMLRTTGVIRRTALTLLGLLGIAASLAFGQAPNPVATPQATGPLPQFEVATIKPRDPSARVVMNATAGSAQTVHLATVVRNIVIQAYGVQQRQMVIGGPDWIDKDVYVIDAKIPDDLYVSMNKMTNQEWQKQVGLMLQALLADRFKLKMHTEQREMPVWVLTIAKGGAKLPPPAADRPNADDPDPAKTRAKAMAGGNEAVTPTGLRILNMTLNDMLTAPWFDLGGRPILNETGLNGKYNLTLNWIPNVPRQVTNPNEPPAPPEGQASIFTALEDQFGLKLTSDKRPVEVVVIDSIDRPSEN